MKISLYIGMIMILLTGCENILLGPGPEDTPEANFDVLWKTIDEKYGLFPVCDVNWDLLYSVYRSQIDENTTSTELWDICCGLLSHLENGHVTLINKSYNNWYSADNPSTDIYKSFSINVVKTMYLDNPSVAGDGYVTYGRIRNSSLGYIHIKSFLGVAGGRDWIRDLDEVIEDLDQCEGIIVDVRNNGGGFTRNDLYAASLFIDREITYYFSSLKTGPGPNDFGDPIAKIVNPHPGNAGYVKKNAVLTNRFTASGGEAFTLILNNLPYSTQIGDTTMGAIGEVSHVAQLPNGWTLNYPCTLSVLPDGTSPEGIGIAPDIEINNTLEDVNAGRDKVVEYAIECLTQQQ